MSHNIILFATVKATLHTNPPKETVIRHKFELWQTPSSVTKEALESPDPKEFYVNWLRKIEPQETEREPIYKDPDDPFCADLVGYCKVPSNRVVHEKELEKWLKDHENWLVTWDSN
jgi:hypothetical protein